MPLRYRASCRRPSSRRRPTSTWTPASRSRRMPVPPDVQVRVLDADDDHPADPGEADGVHAGRRPQQAGADLTARGWSRGSRRGLSVLGGFGGFGSSQSHDLGVEPAQRVAVDAFEPPRFRSRSPHPWVRGEVVAADRGRGLQAARPWPPHLSRGHGWWVGWPARSSRAWGAASKTASRRWTAPAVEPGVLRIRQVPRDVPAVPRDSWSPWPFCPVAFARTPQGRVARLDGVGVLRSEVRVGRAVRR